MHHAQAMQHAETVHAEAATMREEAPAPTCWIACDALPLYMLCCIPLVRWCSHCVEGVKSSHSLQAAAMREEAEERHAAAEMLEIEARAMRRPDLHRHRIGTQLTWLSLAGRRGLVVRRQRGS